jgi:homopolymeric O-antigen transport system ATP-binding protein
MSSDTAIRVENLSKLYRIGLRQNQHKTIREIIQRNFLRPFKWFSSNGSSTNVEESLWALKDVSFDIERGQIVGVIGRNGAGKSTLLKILSRITEPTSGMVEITGRIGSLLEVGTGFHPELTGRENIYLSGAILGMSRRQLSDRLDAIVSFAEVDKFIDTPVKHYSSGMYVRLAFAVAAHLDPDILMVDEVLSVGDAAFQKKCLGKMQDVTGRTVLFVSHQMNSIRRLCNRCIWLSNGRVEMFDSTVKVVSAYEAAVINRDSTRQPEDSNSRGHFVAWEILDPKNPEPNLLTTIGPLKFRMLVEVKKTLKNGRHGIALYNSDHQLIWGWAADNLNLQPGSHEFVYSLPGLPLRPGIYSWHVTLFDQERLIDSWYCVPDLIVATEPLSHPRDEWSGILNLPCGFNISSKTSV